MKILLVCLISSAAFAQTAPASETAQSSGFLVDLSGPWRLSPDDRPAYAAPDYDDRAWPSLELPRGVTYFHGKSYWLRRSAQLPAAVDRTQVSLTLGAIQDVYEVYVNGKRIGASGNFDSFEDALTPRARTFEIPPEAIASGGSLRIALRVRGILFYHPSWRLLDEGPYWLTDSAHAPKDAGRRQLEERFVRHSPSLTFAAVFAVIGLISLLGWLSERERKELLWFSLVSFARAFASSYLSLALLADVRPFNRIGITPEFVFGNFQVPFFVEFVFAALGYNSWKLRAALWVGWSGALVALQTSSLNAIWIIGFPAYLWVSCLGLFVILWDWRRIGLKGVAGEQHALRLVLLLSSFSFCLTWSQLLYFNSIAFAQAITTFGEQKIPHIAVGPYHVQIDDIFWLFVSVTILALLFRRLAADRRERQRLSGELEAARMIQQLLLKKSGLSEPGLQMEAVYMPAQEVGGDFYFVLDGQMVFLGDVSGKGLKAAMVVSILIGVLRNTEERQPGAVLQALNRAVTGYIDGFVTCSCARFDAGGQVTIAGGGHPAPYVDGAEVLMESGLPLGVDAEAVYPESPLVLAPGSSMTIVSDGVIEAENAQRELFGFDRTREISGKSAREIAEAAKAWGQNDDITVVTVSRRLA